MCTQKETVPNMKISPKKLGHCLTMVVPFPPLISFPQVNEVAVEDIRPRPQGSSPVYEYSIEEEYLKARHWSFIGAWLYQIDWKDFSPYNKPRLKCHIQWCVVSLPAMFIKGHVHWCLFIFVCFNWFVVGYVLFSWQKKMLLTSFLRYLGHKVSKNDNTFPS